MFFKKLILGLCGLLLVSCSNEQITEESELVVNLAYDTGCFDGFTARWSQWSEGQSDETQVRQDFNCIVDGISYFLLRVRGEKLGSYSSQEIFNFTKKFFRAANLEQQTVDDLLVVKSWLVGGSDQSVSFEELNRISWFLKSSLSTVQNLTPFAEKVFFKSSASDLTDVQAIAIKKSLSTLSQEFKALTVDSRMAVEPAHFTRVFNSLLRQFEMNEVPSDSVHSIWKILAVATGKTPGSNLSFNPSEGLSELAFRAIYIALRFKYGVTDMGWRNINSYVHLESVVYETLTFLKTIVGFQPEKKISQNNLSLVVFEAVNFLNFDFEVDEKWASDSVQILMSRYFNSTSVGESEIDKIGQEWTEFRDFYSETLVLQGLGFTGSLVQDQNFVALSDLNRRTLDFAWPMLSNNEGYVLNPLKSTKIMADYGNLFWVNWQRALASIFIKAYSTDESQKASLAGLTLEELKTGYADVFKTLHGIDYIGADQEDSWFRIFNEANLFVPRAKADVYLSFEEGVDFLALLFSGIAFSGDIFAKMNEACPQPDKKCQLNWFKSGDDIWQNYAPEFAAYLKSSSPAEQESFLEGFEQIARETVQPDPFKRFDLLTVSIAIQYIEIFLRKYDVNHDLSVNFTETVNSFESFKSALLALPQVKGTEAEEDPATLLALYTFFLRRGRLPRQVFGQYVELLGWRQRVNRCVSVGPDGTFKVVNPSGCEYESSRANLLKILAFLSNSL